MSKSIRRVADIPMDYTIAFVSEGVRGIFIVAGNQAGTLITKSIRGPASAITDRSRIVKACFGQTWDNH